jgi:hypothetical protein
MVAVANHAAQPVNLAAQVGLGRLGRQRRARAKMSTAGSIMAGRVGAVVLSEAPAWKETIGGSDAVPSVMARTSRKPTHPSPISLCFRSVPICLTA